MHSYLTLALGPSLALSRPGATDVIRAVAVAVVWHASPPPAALAPCCACEPLQDDELLDELLLDELLEEAAVPSRRVSRQRLGAGLGLGESPLRAERCCELRSVARVSTVALSGEVRIERRVGSAVEDEDVRVIQHAHVVIVGLGEIEKLRPARRPGRTRARHALVAHRAHVLARCEHVRHGERLEALLGDARERTRGRARTHAAEAFGRRTGRLHGQHPVKPKCRALTTPKGPAPSLIDTFAAADAMAKALASEPVWWLCVRAGGAAPISTAAATRRTEQA